jgi:RNA polymerase sigma-70 factor (ECF subfamily)
VPEANAALDASELASSAALLACVERAQAGDRQAFGLLYDQLAPALMAAAERILRGRRESDDLVHDVFLEAWQHIREYDPSKARFRTWLLLRLRSRALDLLARAETRHTRLAHNDSEMDSSVSPSQEHAVEQGALRKALEGLEEGVRNVLDQTYFEGLNAREIAERTGLPLGTVKSRLARGLGALGEALGEKGVGLDE